VIGTQQYREVESNSASARPAREPENIEAAGKARERETNASDPLMVPKARKGRETNVPCPRETESMGAREINLPEKETAAVRRDGEPLASAAMERRQNEAAADRHQAAVGERPPSSVREGIGPMPLSAMDPGRKMQGAVGSDRPQITAAKADRVETSRDDSRPNCDPAVRLHLGAISALARDLTAGTDCLSPLAVRRIINKDFMGSPTAVCSLYRELHEPSVTHMGGDLIERMEKQRPIAGRSVEGSSDIDVERHSCSTTDQQARLAAMKEQLASIAAQPPVLWLSTAGAETSAPAETGLVPAQMQLVPAQMQLVPAEADLVPGEADQGSAEGQLVPARMQLVPAEAYLVPAEAEQGSAEEQPAPAQMQLVPAEADLVPAEADQGSAEEQLVPTQMQLVPTRMQLVSARADLVPAEADLVPAEADLVPVESAEALTSPQRRAGMPAAVGEEPRELQGAGPSPPRKRCNTAGGDGWRGRLSRRNPGLIKEFRGLPPAARLDLVKERGLCSRCLSRCDPKGKRMHKRCRLKSRIENELCQRQHKCMQTHHRLLHVDAEGEKSPQTTRPAKPADRCECEQIARVANAAH
jgi:hypothetical protein